MIADASLELVESGRVKVSPNQQEQVLKPSQDICQVLGKIPTPTHAGKALHILKKTRSNSTVSLLNRFGNSFSYKEVEIYNINGNGSWRLGMVPSYQQTWRLVQFTQFAYDNHDFQEYTTDGWKHCLAQHTSHFSARIQMKTLHQQLVSLYWKHAKQPLHLPSLFELQKATSV